MQLLKHGQVSPFGETEPKHQLFIVQILRIVKLCTVILLAACLQVYATGYSQNKITLSERDAPITKVFEQITKQTGYEFLYFSRVLENAKKVTIEVKEASLEEVLERCFKGQPFEYEIKEKTIVIKQKSKLAHTIEEVLRLQNSIEVRGIIIDENGAPAQGVNIMVKGTTKGTSTNLKGEFTLSDLAENAVLVITSIGYDKQEILVKNRAFISLQLKVAAGNLDETVVVAYGMTTKRLNTGNVSSIKSSEIEKQPISNPLAALQGRIPGMMITQQTGVPGGGFTVQIRGRNSIGAGNEPLFIVDGVPFPSNTLSRMISGPNPFASPMNTINPANIESIEVLKDADATAIYGSRGSNGVVLITTKKGKSGNTKIDINLLEGRSKVTRMMNLLNTEEYIMMRKEAYKNDGITPTVNNGAYDLLVWDTTKYTDWQEEFIGSTAHNTNAQLSASGGNKYIRFLVGGNYYKETTVYPSKLAYKRGTFNFNINNISTNQKFKIELSANYATDNNALPNTDFTLNAVTLAPNVPDLKDSDGNLIWPQFASNPYAVLLRRYSSKTSNLGSNSILSYYLLPQLEIKSSFGYSKLMMDEITTSPIASNNPAFGVTTGSSSFSNSSVRTWIIEPQINWIKKFRNCQISTLVGSTFQETLNKGQSINATGFISDELLKDIRSAGTIAVASSSFVQYRYTSIFARLNYDLQNKYIVNITGRRDGSSRFGSNKQFANFGAIGIAWMFYKESFINKSTPFLSYGKFRGSFGSTGNDRTIDYGYLSLWQPTTSYQNIPTVYPTRLTNPDYAWERNKKLEFALELGFLKDRILLSASWYRNRSDNELVGLPLPPSVGFQNIQANLPAVVQNTGCEFELITSNIKHSDFSWLTNFNITIPKNKLVSYPDFEKSNYVNTYVIGKSLFVVKALHYLSVDPATGVYQFEDVNGNGNGLDNPGDLQAIKQINQDFFGGVQNQFKFKYFQLDVFFQFVKQTGIDPLMSSYFGAPGTFGNKANDVQNRWQKPGDNSEFQKFTTGGGNGSSAYLAYIYGSFFGDKQITDASFIRLKNVSFSYQLPTALLKRLKMHQAKIYLQSQNLLTITSYKGMDPENQSILSLPPLRNITVGFQIIF